MSARTVGLVFLLLLIVPSWASSRQNLAQQEGWIEILEPAEWQGAGTRGLATVPKTSIRVVGVARHPTGIREVQLNGRRASVQPEQDGSVRFVGYVPAEEQLSEVEVLVILNNGRPLVRKYSVNIQAGGVRPATIEARLGTGLGERWAVIVGVSKYQDDRITPLRYADDDAQALYDFLTSEAAGLGGFKKENVLLLLNNKATYREIRTALFTFLKAATEDDLVVIYFAGHGMPDPDRASNLYLLTYDTDVENVSGTAFPMEDVHNAVQRTYARDILVLSDACHSAGVAGQATFRDVSLNQINEQFLDRLQASTGGLTVFTASQVNQLSQEGPQWGGGHGVFTYQLIEGLQGAADMDGDRIVALGEIMEWVRDRVRRETRNAQIPSISQTAFDPYLPLSIVTEVAEAEEQEAETPPAVEQPSQRPEAEAATPEETPPTSAALLSPGSAAGRSVIPGLGQFYTGQNGKGAGLMAAGFGALAAGFLVKSTTEECAVTPPEGSRCPDYLVISSSTSRPLLPVGIIGWAATAVYSAYDAHKKAKEINEGILSGTPSLALNREGTIRLLPPALSSEFRKISVEVLRVRF